MNNVVQFARMVGDSLTNLVSRMGTDRDKAAHGYYAAPVLTDDQITFAYRGAWLPRKIVDIPALDSCRKWRNWQAKSDQVEKIEAEEKRLNVRGKVLEARTKARLFGGAAILIGTGEESLTEELKADRIGEGGIKYLTVLTRRQLTAGEMDRDPASEWYGKPSLYTISGQSGQQVEVHPSRLVIFHGNQTADDDIGASVHAGWGDSVLISVLDAIKNADSTAANIATLVFEAKIDIIKVPNFMASLGDEGYKQKILERYTLANTAKGINGTLMLDKEEDYESKSASFATLPDILDRFLQITAGAADIPVTRLLGQSPAGMNATGESDLRNYYDRVSAMQEIEMTPAMFRLDECLIRSALGARDASIYYTWAPLWQISEREKADILKAKADAGRAIAGTGGLSPALMPIEALSDALVNALVEDGSLPGLEGAIEQYGTLGEQEDDDDDLRGALPPSARPDASLAASDAAPRTLYVSRKLLNAQDIIDHFKAQGVETTLPADDMHVTITFSRQAVDWMKMGQAWEAKIEIAEGGPRLMDKFGPEGKALVLLFRSFELEWRHESMVANGASWDWPEYQPHVTISHAFEGDIEDIEPYQGPLRFGPEIFAEVNEDWHEAITEE